jgi:uncharacterized protein (DUF885 family)
MIDRRRLLQTAVAAGAFAPVVGSLGACASQGAAPSSAADALVAEIGEASVDANPALASNLGLDTGARAALKGQFSPKGVEGRAAAIARNDAWLAKIKAIDASKLTGQSAASFGVVKFQAETLDTAKGFGYGDFGFVDASAYPIQPYTISQLTGTYQFAARLPRHPACDRDHRRTPRPICRACRPWRRPWIRRRRPAAPTPPRG